MRRSLAVAAIVVCVACGCGKRSTTVTGPDGTKVTVDQSGGKVEIKGVGADGSTTSFSAGGVKVPDDFPKDVPIYPGATPILHTSVKSSRSLVLKTSDAADKVTAFYKDKLKAEGWTQEAEFNIGGGASLSNTKDNRTLAVVVSHDDEGTSVNLSVMAKE